MSTDEYEAGRARLDALVAWWESEGAQDRNEATTRLHAIDELLVGALGWPRGQVIAEKRYAGKYADYSLGEPSTRLIVEAKKEGIYFELPAGVGSGTMQLKTVMEAGAPIDAAVRQVLGYCQERSVPIAAVTNGHQLIAFLASRLDNVPPLEGRALVFDSLAAMRDSFQTLWDALSAPGIEGLAIVHLLDAGHVRSPPAKLSSRIPDYPGFWMRNRMQTELKILGDLVLQDIAQAPELEEEFLTQCYSSSNTLSEYALVSREILEARYSAIAAESEADLSPARAAAGITEDLRSDVLTASLGRRP